ncbi:GapS6a family protein [Aeromonas sp. 600527]|uniref:GapS6a family protein n=1 Tax=Aeromonas TaxID=642 RepID=UPI003BA1F88C
MTFLTSTILSGILYDTLKKGTIITGEFIKETLKDWIVDDNTAESLANKLKESDHDISSLRREAIQDFLESSQQTLDIIKTIRSTQESNSYHNYHSGTGDIVNGNKIINQK